MKVKIVHDARPYRSFAVQISFNAGWRHEPVKMRGAMRKSLENLLSILSFRFPSWFEMSYVMDSEYSSVIIRGPSSDQDSVLKIVKILDVDFPDAYRHLGASVEMVVASGGIKRKLLESLSEVGESRGIRPEVISRPKRFLALRELSRVQKHFLVYTFRRRGCEVFLEISPRGDRVHYGRDVQNFEYSLEEEKRFYLAWITLRWESTFESVKILTTMNLFSKSVMEFEDVLREVNNIKDEEFLNSVELLKRASGR